MSATYARVTPSLPCGNPNASQTDERPVQLTRTDGHETRTDGHVDNLTTLAPSVVKLGVNKTCIIW